jgi:hypothetical protein
VRLTVATYGVDVSSRETGYSYALPQSRDYLAAFETQLYPPEFENQADE